MSRHAVLVACFSSALVGSSALSLKSRGEEPWCLVWHSQHKSAGMVLANTLKKGKTNEGFMPSHYMCDRKTWNCSAQECLHDKRVSPKTNRLAMRGYTPMLSERDEWRNDKCIWATMSRDPVSRLVSAYYYCQFDSPGDPLCGKSQLRAKKRNHSGICQALGQLFVPGDDVVAKNLQASQRAGQFPGQKHQLQRCALVAIQSSPKRRR